jgi:hypothetical protein
MCSRLRSTTGGWHAGGGEETSEVSDPRRMQLDGVRGEVGRLEMDPPRLGQAGEVG